MSSEPAPDREPRLAARVAALLAPHASLLALATLLVLTSTALTVAAPLLLQKIIDEALPAHDVALLGLLCGGMITAGFLSNLTSLHQGRLIYRVGQRVVHDLRMKVYDQVQRSPLTFFASESNSRTQSILVSDIGEISDTLTFSLQSLLLSGTGLLAAVGVIMALNWKIGLLSIVLALGLSLVNRRLARRRFMLTNLRQDRVADMMRRVEEDLSYLGVVAGRTLGRTGFQRGRFLAASLDTARLTFEERMAGRTGYAWFGSALACIPPAIYWVAGTAFPEISVGTIIIIAMLQMRLTDPIENLMLVSADIQSSLAVFKRVFAVMDLETDPSIEPSREERDGSAGTPLPRPPATLELDGIGYSYPGAARPALTGVNLTVRPGEVTMLAGPSGSGKSTLGLIIAGLLTPLQGGLRLAGRPVDPRQLRGVVTLVPQEAPVFNASIRENLLFGRPDATQDDLERVLGAVRLTSLVRSLPAKLDTVVGERGYELSGGERQRLALARALLSPSPILVLDEAVSALDVITGAEVHASVLHHCADRSLIFIAHRIPVLAHEDTVVLIDQGRVTEHGTHAGLLDRHSAYAHLVRSQTIVAAPAPAPAPVPDTAGQPDS